MTILSQRPGALSAPARTRVRPGPSTRRRHHGMLHRRWLRIAADTAAGALAAGALLLAHPQGGEHHLTLAVGLFLLWPIAMSFGINPSHRLDLPRIGTGPVLRGALRVGALLAIVAWLVESELPPHHLVAAVAAAAAASLTLRLVHRLLAERGTQLRRLLLVGPTEIARQFSDAIADPSRATGRLDLVGQCRPDLEEILAEATRTRADDIVVTGSELDPGPLRELSWRLAADGRTLHLAPGLIGVGAGRVSAGSVGGVPVMSVTPSELSSVRRTASHLLGRLVAGTLLLVGSPLLALIALTVRLDSPGPVLFRQSRIGQDGRPFTMIKFRTMDHLVEAPDSDDVDNVLFKARQDPRVTRVGALLRKYSLDELPQLINVVRGEMALIGPRPALPCEVAKYAGPVHRRLAVRPGMTGLWQVSGRSDLAWDATVRLDLDYVDNWTPTLDAAILARTVPAVLGHRGAY